MATIMITRPIIILKVKRKSNKNAGNGRINIEIINSTSAGTPSVDSSILDISCRMFDSIAEAI
jgi:hypothetical protein